MGIQRAILADVFLDGRRTLNVSFYSPVLLISAKSNTHHWDMDGSVWLVKWGSRMPEWATYIITARSRGSDGGYDLVPSQTDPNNNVSGRTDCRAVLQLYKCGHVLALADQ